jgi:predicted ATPase
VVVEHLTVCPTTFGREPQLRRVRQLVDQLLTGRGATVLVTGEAGIGKTRVVREARAEASTRGVRVLEGSAFELDHALPYGPITDLFRTFLASTSPQDALDELGPAIVPLARLLPALAAWLPPRTDSPVDDKQQMLQGLLLAFDRLIERGPTLVVVEDVHWADEASLDLLLHLARSAASRGLLLILTLRTEDAGSSVNDWRR